MMDGNYGVCRERRDATPPRLLDALHSAGWVCLALVTLWWSGLWALLATPSSPVYQHPVWWVAVALFAGACALCVYLALTIPKDDLGFANYLQEAPVVVSSLLLVSVLLLGCVGVVLWPHLGGWTPVVVGVLVMGWIHGMVLFPLHM